MLDRRLQGRQYDVYLLDVRPEDGHARCKRESRKERQALDPFTECRWMLQEAQAAGATRHEDESLPVGIEHLCEDIVIWMSDVQDLEIFLVDRSSRKIASTMTVSMIDAMMMMKCKISFSRVVMPALDYSSTSQDVQGLSRRQWPRPHLVHYQRRSWYPACRCIWSRGSYRRLNPLYQKVVKTHLQYG